MLFFLNSISNLITKRIFGKVKKRTEIWNYYFFLYIFCFHIMIKLILLLYDTVVQFSFFFFRIHPIIEILGILCFLTILLINRSFYCYLLLYKPLFSVLTQDGKQFYFILVECIGLYLIVNFSTCSSAASSICRSY